MFITYWRTNLYWSTVGSALPMHGCRSFVFSLGLALVDPSISNYRHQWILPNQRIGLVQFFPVKKIGISRLFSLCRWLAVPMNSNFWSSDWLMNRQESANPWSAKWPADPRSVNNLSADPQQFFSQFNVVSDQSKIFTCIFVSVYWTEYYVCVLCVQLLLNPLVKRLKADPQNFTNLPAHGLGLHLSAKGGVGLWIPERSVVSRKDLATMMRTVMRSSACLTEAQCQKCIFAHVMHILLIYYA